MASVKFLNKPPAQIHGCWKYHSQVLNTVNSVMLNHQHLPRKVSRGHLIQMPKPTQLAPLDVEEQRLYSELLPGDRTPHPISKVAPNQPTEETHFGRLYRGSHSFGHDPKFMNIGEGMNIDWQVNWELRLLAQLFLHHRRPTQRPHYSGCCTDPSVNLTFHPSLTREEDPKILELLHLRQELYPNPESRPPFSCREPWPRTWRGWFSFKLLLTQLQTTPGHAGGPGSKEPTRQHCLQKAEMKSPRLWIAPGVCLANSPL